MFEYLGSILVNVDPGFDVLRYLTVRTLGGTCLIYTSDAADE